MNEPICPGCVARSRSWGLVCSSCDSVYFAVRDDIEEDTYEPPDRWVVLSSLAVLFLGAGVIYYVFTVPLEMSAVLIE